MVDTKRKKMRVMFFLVAFVPVIALGTEPSTSFDASLQRALQDTSSHVPLLGMGITSINENVRNNCLVGTAVFVRSPRSYFFSGTESAGVGSLVSPSLDRTSFEQGDALFDFSRVIRPRGYSAGFFFQASLYFGNQTLVVEGLNALGTTSHANGPAAFFDSCGDRFISQREIGGLFYRSFQVQFANSSEYLEFDSKFTSFDIIELNDESAAAIQASGIDGVVVFRAIQVGGDPLQLFSLKGAAGQNLAPTAICSFRDLRPCRELNAALASYPAAFFSEQHAAEKFTDPANYNGASLLGVHLQDYGPTGVAGIGSYIDSAKDIHGPLSRLAVDRAGINADIDRVEILLGYFAHRLTSEQVVNLKNLKDTLNGNALSVKAVALGCFDSPDTCDVNVRDLTLSPVNPELFYLPKKAAPSTAPNSFDTVDSGGGILDFSSLLGLISLLVARIARRRIRIMLVAR